MMSEEDFTLEYIYIGSLSTLAKLIHVYKVKFSPGANSLIQ